MRIRRIIIVILLFFTLLPFSVFAQSSEEIKKFENIINIRRDGTIDVQEEITYDFGQTNRHGIIRTIPMVKKNKSNKEFKLDLKVSSVVDDNGDKYNYVLSESNNKLNIKIGNSNKLISGIHIYIIRYKVSGAITYFPNFDELYWNVTGNEWNIPIMSATSEINLAGNIDKSICYTGVFGSNATDCSISVEGQKAYFNTNAALPSRQGLSVVVDFPKNIVAVLEPKEVSHIGEQIIGFGILFLALLWYVVYPIWLPIKWFLYGRDPETPASVHAWFDPPKTNSGRFLTPEETGALTDEKAEERDVFAMIIHLAQKGYFKIIEKEESDFYLKKLKGYENELLPFEKEIFDKLFSKNDEVKLKDQKLYETFEKAKNDIYKQLIEEGYFPKDPNSIRKYYQLIFILSLATLNIPLAVTAKIYGDRMPKKTLFGAQSAKRAQALKNFLNSQGRQLNFQGKKQMLFEKLLPYAIAFGVEKNWAKRFEDMKITAPVWYESYDHTNFNSYVFYHSLSRNFSSLHSANMAPVSSRSFSSGSSGGSSGGGGGGGGGGSW